MRVFLALAGLSVLVLAGCGGPTQVDASKTEGLIEEELPALLRSSEGKRLRRQLGVSRDEKASSIDCPSGRDVEPGATFACVITFENGEKASVKLEIADKEADLNLTEATPLEPKR